jgi:hypothetical protein
MKKIESLKKHKVHGVQIRYVLDHLEGENDASKINKFWQTYYDEWYCHNHTLLYPNEQDRVAEYLRALPSGVNFAWTNHEILQQLASWGYDTSDEKKAERMLDRWWNVLAFRLIQLRDAV